MLARLAHVTARHRKAIIFAWIALTDLRRLRRRSGLGALAPVLLDPRLLRLRGEPADVRAVRHRRAPPERRRVPDEGRRDQERRDCRRDGARARDEPGCPRQLLLLDGQRRVRLQGQAHDLHGGLSGRLAGVRREERRRSDAEGCVRRPAAGNDRARDGPGSDHGGERERRDGRSERPRRGADRRPRRADHPLLRLRDAAGGPAAARNRRVVDPEHVHARLDPHLRHRRVDRRAVPDRARRPRRRDRLRAAARSSASATSCARARTWRPLSSRR